MPEFFCRIDLDYPITDRDAEILRKNGMDLVCLSEHTYMEFTLDVGDQKRSDELVTELSDVLAKNAAAAGSGTE